MDRPNDPSDPTKPNHVARPVRPTVLDAAKIEVERTPERPPPKPARSRAPAEEAVELTTPCQSCGYDLRGLPAGGRCPECGAAIPKRLRKITSGEHKQDLRETLADAWRGFAVASLAPIALLTPLPYVLPLGVGIAVALGFAPLFRLHSLKQLKAMPDAMQAAVSTHLARFRVWQIVELVPVAIVVVYALAATFAAIPAEFAPLYFATVAAWWILAIEVVVRVLSAGHALAVTLVEPAALPPIGRAVRCARFGQVACFLGLSTAIVALALLAAGSSEQITVLSAGIGLLLAAAFLGGYACVIGYAHAPVVAECIYDCELFRTRPRDPDDDLPPPFPARDRDDSTPSRQPGSAPRPNDRPAWEDEDKIPLA